MILQMRSWRLITAHHATHHRPILLLVLNEFERIVYLLLVEVLDDGRLLGVFLCLGSE